MYGLKEQLLQEQNRLQSIIAKAREKDIAAPEGRLRISVDSGVAQNYQCIDDRAASDSNESDNNIVSLNKMVE